MPDGDWYDEFRTYERSPPPPRPSAAELMADFQARRKAPAPVKATPSAPVCGPVDQFGVSAVLRAWLAEKYGEARPFAEDDQPLTFTKGDVDFERLGVLHDMQHADRVQSDAAYVPPPNPWAPPKDRGKSRIAHSLRRWANATSAERATWARSNLGWRAQEGK